MLLIQKMETGNSFFPKLDLHVKEILAGIAILDTERKRLLQPISEYVRKRHTAGDDVRLNMICTHNSRRSHLAQVWAQTAAAYYHFKNVHCYSGGTQETALYPAVAESLARSGFHVTRIGSGPNPVYAFQYDQNDPPIIGFSKKYGHPFNPQSGFAAVMTCSQADGDCPLIPGADARFSLPYEDPKISDGTPGQGEVYAQRSLQIATEMFYVFSQINTDVRK